MKKIIGVICIFVIVLLSGCEENIYAGIEKNDIPDIPNAANTEFVYEYKGHSDHWAAVFIIYKMKDNDENISKLLLKYIGEKPNPTGEISYVYDAGSDLMGSGTMSFMNEPVDGIYFINSSTDYESVPDKDSIVNLLINWNANEHSDVIELKPENH